jgi:hypothetical protein
VSHSVQFFKGKPPILDVQALRGEERLMPLPIHIHVGAILIDETPRITQLLGFESESYSGNWRLVRVLSGFSLERKIRASGWNFFFMATEVKAIIIGTLGANKIQNALKRILQKVRGQRFNSLEVTGIEERRFLGLPYAVVSAHSRHIQQSCYLDSVEMRRTSQHDQS